MELNKDKILTEKLLRFIEQGKGYECNLEYFTSEIRKYRQEIETEFAPRIKERTRIDEDYPLKSLTERDGKIQGNPPIRTIPTIESGFVREESIEEL